MPTSDLPIDPSQREPHPAGAAEARARRLAGRIRAVAAAGSSVIGARSLERLRQAVQEACSRVISFDEFALSVYDPEGDTLSSSDPASQGATVVGNGRRSESAIRVPLLLEDRVLGMLSIQSYTPGLYTDEDVEVLETLAALGAAALLNIQYLTEREGAQRVLRESEERFRHLVNALPAIVYIAEAEPPFGPVYVSSAAASLGYPMREWTEQPDLWFNILHPEDRARVLEQILAAQAARTPLDYEYRVVARDGAVHWFHDIGSFVRDEAGRVLYWQGVMMDVTDQHRAEQAAREGERRYRVLFDQVPVGIFRSTPSGRFLDANPAMAAILGCPDVETLLDIPAIDFYVDPEDRVRWRELLARDGVATGFEIRFRRIDGSIIWARHSARAVNDENGTLTCYEGVFEDITERRGVEQALREREEYFRTLTESSTETVAVLNRDATVRYSNAPPRLQKEGAQGSNARSAFETIHPEDLADAHTLFQTILLRPDEVQTAVVRSKGANGAWRTLHVTARNLLDRPPVSGIVVNSVDITERVKLEERLRQASKMEAVGKLAGGIAHDFNNLLTAIRGTAEFLLEDLPEGDPTREDVEEIRKAADRAADLTRQLLAFSRRQVLMPRVLRLNDRIMDMQKMLSRVIGADVEIVTRLDPMLGEVTADPTQIEQVILNLAVNARDAMPAGGVLILETRNVELSPGGQGRYPNAAPGHYVQLEVMDTGSGISPEVLPHIFDPFFTTKPVGAGTGLGLATVLGVVEQSGGYVWAESWTARGTRFTVLLPRTDSAPSAEPPPQPRPDPSHGKAKILLVEDEPSVRVLARKILLRLGYEVLEAENGEEAVRVAALHPETIDLLVTDVVMPRMGGRETAWRVREACPGVRVVYMSGYTEDAIARHGVLEPGTVFIQKPFTPAAFASTIQEVLAAAPSDHGRR